MEKLKIAGFQISFLLILFLPIACRQKYIWFTELQRTHQADTHRVVRVYMDRYGDFYPSDKIYIDSRYFLPEKPLNTIASASLEHYFTSSKERIDELSKFYSEPAGGSPTEVYRNIQTKILQNYAAQIGIAGDKYKSKQVVIVVHGFNDPNPTGTYQELRNAIDSNSLDKNRELLYIEIYWDGLSAYGGNPGLSKIWALAQFNSRYVALGLRSLMNKLPPKLPVVMITHSLGASVGTGALFNTFYKWNDKEMSDSFKEITELSKEPYPKGPVKLGMLAAAIPGEGTFHDLVYEPNSDVISGNNNIQRIVVAINPFDYALHKGVFGTSRYLSPRFGATTLGNNYNKEAEKVRTLLMKKYPSVDHFYFTIPFSTPAYGGESQEHGLHFYLEDKVPTKKFLNELLRP